MLWCPWADYAAIKTAHIATRRVAEATIDESHVFEARDRHAIADWDAPSEASASFVREEMHAIGREDEATWDPEALPEALPLALRETLGAKAHMRTDEYTSSSGLDVAIQLELFPRFEAPSRVSLVRHRWDGFSWTTAAMLHLDGIEC